MRRWSEPRRRYEIPVAFVFTGNEPQFRWRRLAPLSMSVDPLRRQILVKARSLVVEHAEQDYRRAIRQAARRLCRGRIPHGRLPQSRELHSELQRTAADHAAGRSPDPIRVDPLFETAESSDQPIRRDRFCLYQALLEPLAEVWLNPSTHPEGDALYHSLQVYALVREAAPFDEELQLAGLLHEVGRTIDPRGPIEAGLDVLADEITPRTAWFIANHEEAHRFCQQTLGLRARRRLMAHEDFESLETLAECDRFGRVIGAPVPDIAQALADIRDLSCQEAECESEDFS